MIGFKRNEFEANMTRPGMIKHRKTHFCGFFVPLAERLCLRFCLPVAAIIVIGFLATIEATAIAQLTSSLSQNQTKQSLSDKQNFFSRVTPGRKFSFPQDHNIHAGFQTEWWYVTANLLGEDGLDYGAQFTLFRTSLIVGGKPQPIFFAHAALTTQSEFYHAERYARADMGHGGVESEPWLAFLDHWQFKGTGKNPLPGSLSVTEKDFGYRLNLSASPYFLQGEKGFSQKDAKGLFASYYYNAPFIKIDGEIQFDGKPVKVAGDAWFDREWSSTSITDGALGWDWLALHLDTGTALLIYRVRSGGEININGTIMRKSGQQRRLAAIDMNWRPLQWAEFNGRKYPIVWQLAIPSEEINLTITPVNNNQFLHTTTPYWEGAVKTRGSHSVKGYLELYGY
jgi:predicted secreted hydrolase